MRLLSGSLRGAVSFRLNNRGVRRNRSRKWPGAFGSGVVGSSAIVTVESLESRTLLSATTASAAPATLGAGTPTALDAYVAAADPAYAYSLNKTIAGPGYTAYVLDMTSQTWRSPAEVDRTLWQHWVTVVVPNTVTTSTGILLIGGGNNSSTPPTVADPTAVATATTTGAVTVYLQNVPNQPLTFAGETLSRREDEIIAYTFDQFLDGGDQNWPLLLPMVKSAVRTMDTAQSFVAAQTGGALQIDDFIVSGASKRGWTTWLTAVVDDRVRAIVPFVIDVLNMDEQMDHHLENYVGVTDLIVNGYSAWIQDYSTLNVMQRMNTPAGQNLLKIVDPFEYRDRSNLAIPKYLVNGTGDEFFVPDSAQFYFHDLPGNNYLRYVPNVGHGLNADAVTGAINFEKAFLAGAALPRFSWDVRDLGTTIDVSTIDAPTSVKLWQATNPTNRDFRIPTFGPQWTSSTLVDQGGGRYVAHAGFPLAGATAFMVEMSYIVNGIPLTFTTQVSMLPTADFGDAPASYPTSIAQGGAAHLLGSGLYLGSGVESDSDGQPGALADADALDNGVLATSAFVAGQAAWADVVASKSGYYNSWIDYNADGDWNDPGEQVFVDQLLVAGTNRLNWTFPANAAVGATFARARLSSLPGLSFDGLARDGEVEDYRLGIDAPLNRPPLAVDDGSPNATGFTTDERSSFNTASVLANDADPDPSDVLFVSSFDTTGTAGLVSSNGNGTFAYNPNGRFDFLQSGQTATDAFRYTVSDGHGGTSTATVTITILGRDPLPVTAAFQQGVNGYNAMIDASIQSGSPSKNYGSSSDVLAHGNPDKAALFKWDSRTISPGSTVQSASITFTVKERSTQAYELYALLRPWVESQVTWKQAASGNAWSVAGATAAADRSPTVLGQITPSATGQITISLNAAGVAAIQSWINGTAANNGFIIQDYNNTDGVAFYSSEASNLQRRPKLTVRYLPYQGAPPVAAVVRQSQTTEPSPTPLFTAQSTSSFSSAGSTGTNPAVALQLPANSVSTIPLTAKANSEDPLAAAGATTGQVSTTSAKKTPSATSATLGLDLLFSTISSLSAVLDR